MAALKFVRSVSLNIMLETYHLPSYRFGRHFVKIAASNQGKSAPNIPLTEASKPSSIEVQIRFQTLK
jgi:hypothetical protein